MSKSELYQKGEALRRQLYGDEAVEKANREIYDDPIMHQFIDVATETVFGGLWSRPGLDLKTRALVCVVSDVTTGREKELAIHLRFALNQGWTEEELVEVMLHLSGYVGLPLVRGAIVGRQRIFRRGTRKVRQVNEVVRAD